MTHRERVIAAINHKEPDRIPIDLGGTRCSAIHFDGYEALRDFLGLGPTSEVARSALRYAEVEEDVLEYFDIDTRALSTGDYDGYTKLIEPDDSYIDEWGCRFQRPPDGHYYDVVYSPFAEEATLEALDNHPWPDPEDPGLIRGVRERARYLHKETDYAVMAALPGGCVDHSQFMRGFEGWFMDFALNREFITSLMDRILEMNLRISERFLDEVGEYVDIVWMADDVATKTGSMVSPKDYRELIKPRHKKIFDLVKEKTNAKIWFHSCGNISGLLDDFIEIGIDIINPVQVSAEGMDTKALKERFGDRIVFWGAVDTTFVLPNGSPDDVRVEVRKRIGDLGHGGGYVLAPVHNIQYDVPSENICAMYDEVLGR